MDAGSNCVLRAASSYTYQIGAIDCEKPGTLNSTFTKDSSPCNLKAFGGQSLALSTASLIPF